MAFSKEQLDALEESIAQGALSVQYNERRVTYQSFPDMLRLRDSMRSELGIASPVTSRARFINLPTGKGL